MDILLNQQIAQLKKGNIRSINRQHLFHSLRTHQSQLRSNEDHEGPECSKHCNSSSCSISLMHIVIYSYHYHYYTLGNQHQQNRLYVLYIYIYIYIYIHVVPLKGVWSGRTQYLPTSFTQRLLQGRKCYSGVICDVAWFRIEYLTSNIIIVVMLQLFIEFSNCQWFIIHRLLFITQFIIHCLVLDLDHLDRVYKGLRSKNSLAFLRLT